MLSIAAAMAAASALAVIVAAATSPRPGGFHTRLAASASGALLFAPLLHLVGAVLVGGAHPTDAAALHLSAMVSAFAAAPLWVHTRGAGTGGLVALALEPQRWARSDAAAAVYPALGAAGGAWLGSAVALYDWAEAAGQVMPVPGALGCVAGWVVGWGVAAAVMRENRRRGGSGGDKKAASGRGRGRGA